jgi:hypothetical protein
MSMIRTGKCEVTGVSEDTKLDKQASEEAKKKKAEDFVSMKQPIQNSPTVATKE